MATHNKFDTFVQDVAHGVHDFSADQLVVALTNTAPVATNTTLVDVTEVDYTHCSSRNITTSASAQTAGTYKLTLADLTLTASGGSVGPFRYAVVYNDGSVSDSLVAWFDYGSSITLADGESLLIDFNDANGLLQLA